MNVQRWERVISDEEDTFEKCKQNEEKQRAGIDVDKVKKQSLFPLSEIHKEEFYGHSDALVGVTGITEHQLTDR